MLRPSYTELMDIVNQDADTDDMITSRYSIVIAAAKRARQIIDGASYDARGMHSDKAVSIAIYEIQHGLIKIYPEGSSEFDENGKYLPSKPRTGGRHAQGVSISAESVISPKELNDETDYGEDIVGAEDIDEIHGIEDDGLFEEDGAKGSKKGFGFREDGYEKRGAFSGEDEGYSTFDYAEDDLELELEEDDYDYGDGEQK